MGTRVRDHRIQRKLTQEDMISFGFSFRHWQMIEAGRPITVITLLRVGKAFGISVRDLIDGIESRASHEPKV